MRLVGTSPKRETRTSPCRVRNPNKRRLLWADKCATTRLTMSASTRVLQLGSAHSLTHRHVSHLPDGHSLDFPPSPHIISFLFSSVFVPCMCLSSCLKLAVSLQNSKTAPDQYLVMFLEPEFLLPPGPEICVGETKATSTSTNERSADEFFESVDNLTAGNKTSASLKHSHSTNRFPCAILDALSPGHPSVRSIVFVPSRPFVSVPYMPDSSSSLGPVSSRSPPA